MLSDAKFFLLSEARLVFDPIICDILECPPNLEKLPEARLLPALLPSFLKPLALLVSSLIVLHGMEIELNDLF